MKMTMLPAYVVGLSLVIGICLGGCSPKTPEVTDTPSPVVSDTPTQEPNKTINNDDGYDTVNLRQIFDENVGLEVIFEGDAIPSFTILDPDGMEHQMSEYTIHSQENYLSITIDKAILGVYKIKYDKNSISNKDYDSSFTMTNNYLKPEVTVNIIEVTNESVKFSVSGLNILRGDYSIDIIDKNNEIKEPISISQGSLAKLVNEYTAMLDTSTIDTSKIYDLYVDVSYPVNGANELAYDLFEDFHLQNNDSENVVNEIVEE